MRFQPIDSTGEVIGKFTAQPCFTKLHGWFFDSTDAAAQTITFYKPTVTGNTPPGVPSAAGTKLFAIEVPAGLSKEFFEGEGIIFEDGVFAITSAATLTGGVVYS